MTLHHCLILSGILFTIGAFGMIRRRNLIMMLLSAEIMVNAVNLSFIAFSSFGDNLGGQVAALFVIAIAASEVAIGLAIAVLLFRQKGKIDTGSLATMKW